MAPDLGRRLVPALPLGLGQLPAPHLRGNSRTLAHEVLGPTWTDYAAKPTRDDTVQTGRTYTTTRPSRPLLGMLSSFHNILITVLTAGGDDSLSALAKLAGPRASWPQPFPQLSQKTRWNQRKVAKVQRRSAARPQPVRIEDGGLRMEGVASGYALARTQGLPLPGRSIFWVMSAVLFLATALPGCGVASWRAPAAVLSTLRSAATGDGLRRTGLCVNGGFCNKSPPTRSVPSEARKSTTPAPLSRRPADHLGVPISERGRFGRLTQPP